jgi:hypothetical protein
MKGIKRSVVVIGQLLGVILGEDFNVPTSQPVYENPTGRYVVWTNSYYGVSCLPGTFS